MKILKPGTKVTDSQVWEIEGQAASGEGYSVKCKDGDITLHGWLPNDRITEVDLGQKGSIMSLPRGTIKRINRAYWEGYEDGKEGTLPADRGKREAIKININDEVTVSLTEKGKSIWEDYCGTWPLVNELEVSVWELMSAFGPHMYISADTFFVKNIVEVHSGKRGTCPLFECGVDLAKPGTDESVKLNAALVDDRFQNLVMKLYDVVCQVVRRDDVSDEGQKIKLSDLILAMHYWTQEKAIELSDKKRWFENVNCTIGDDPLTRIPGVPETREKSEVRVARWFGKVLAFKCYCGYLWTSEPYDGGSVVAYCPQCHSEGRFTEREILSMKGEVK